MTRHLSGFLLLLPLCLSCSTVDSPADTDAAGTAGGTANGPDAGDDGGQTGQMDGNDDTMGGGEQDGTPDTGADDDPDGGNPGEAGCCVRHSEPSCNEPAVAECVCAVDATCCTFEWDDNCVDAARNDCDATCEGMDAGVMDDMGMTDDVGDMMDDGTAGPMDEGTDNAMDDMGDVMDEGGGDVCCMPSKMPGCADAAVEACVCGDDPFCCEMEWDFQCIQEAAQFCNADCGGGPGDGGMGGTGCCEPHFQAGCDDMMVEQCVCAFDQFCCNQSWDDQCVDEAANDCMAGC